MDSLFELVKLFGWNIVFREIRFRGFLLRLRFFFLLENLVSEERRFLGFEFKL